MAKGQVTYLRLSVLIYEMGITISMSQGYCDNENKNELMHFKMCNILSCLVVSLINAVYHFYLNEINTI